MVLNENLFNANVVETGVISEVQEAKLKDVLDNMSYKDGERIYNDIKEKLKEENELPSEFSNENISNINEFVNQVLFENNLDSSHQAGVIDMVAENFSGQPIISNALKDYSDFLFQDKKLSQGEIDKKSSELQSLFVENGYILNLDFLSSGGELIIKIEGVVEPGKELLSIFGDEFLGDKKTYIIDDSGLISQGKNIGGVNIVNTASIKGLLSYGEKVGRYSGKETEGFDINRVVNSVSNHELSHEILGNNLRFDNRKEYSTEEGKQMMVEGLDFIPLNSIQVEEFISHSIGQLTDRFELETNIANAIMDLKSDENGAPIYDISNDSGDYALIQKYVLKKLSDIMADKGIVNFEGKLLAKIGNEYDKYYEKLDKNGENLDNQSLLDEVTVGVNKIIGDVIKSLDNNDTDFIVNDCVAQAKIYIDQVENKTMM